MLKLTLKTGKFKLNGDLLDINFNYGEINMSQWDYDNAEPDYYREDYECSELKKLKYKLKDVSEFFEAILESLYGKGPLDAALLEFQLDEVAYKLGIDVEYTTLNIERKNQTIANIAHFLSLTSPQKIPA